MSSAQSAWRFGDGMAVPCANDSLSWWAEPEAAGGSLAEGPCSQVNVIQWDQETHSRTRQWRQRWTGKNWAGEQMPSSGTWVWDRFRAGREWGCDLGKEKQKSHSWAGTGISDEKADWERRRF